MYEPKKSPPKPQSDDEEQLSSEYGERNFKGYIHISIYHKMRKRQYGNKWTTQFVPLCREEVRRLEERGEMEQNGNIRNTVQDYINDIEHDSPYINSMHGVT